jgi:hypothetical protein
MARKSRSSNDFVCPYCHARVPEGKTACPACGSDEETGWSDDPDVWSDANLPGGAEEDDEDYEEWLERDRPDQMDRSPVELIKQSGWLLVVAILVGLIVAGMMFKAGQ